MSIKAMNWAWNQSVGSTTAKLVLMKLADNADDSCCGFPSIALIARQCEINERTVQRTIRMLEAAGHLHVEARFRNRRRTSNAYYLNVPGAMGGNLPPMARTPPPPLAPAPPLPPAPVSGCGGVGVTGTTTEPPNKESTTRTTNCEPDRLHVLETLPPSVRAEARRALSSFPADLAQTVADEWSAYLRQGHIRNPMAYLTTLVKRARSGHFVPELAGAERARRQSSQSESIPASASQIVQQVTSQLAQRWGSRTPKQDVLPRRDDSDASHD